MIYVIYGIGVLIGWIIAIAICFKLDEDGGPDHDETTMAIVIPFFWPIFLPIAIIFGLGWLVYIAFLEKR